MSMVLFVMLYEIYFQPLDINYSVKVDTKEIDYSICFCQVNVCHHGHVLLGRCYLLVVACQQKLWKKSASFLLFFKKNNFLF